MSDRIAHILDPSDCLHAVSQGALGIECREDDERARALLEGLNHPETRIMCIGERAMMRTLEGGCSVPIGVNSRIENEKLHLRGLVASLDGQQVVEYEDNISLDGLETLHEKEAAATELGRRVANKMIDLGAGAILKELAH